MTRFLDQSFERGKSAYESGYYRSAYQHFQMLYQLRPDDQRIAYYYRLAYDKSRRTIHWQPFSIVPPNATASAFVDAIFSQLLRQKSPYLTVHRSKGERDAVPAVSGNIQLVSPVANGPCEALVLTISITLPGKAPMTSSYNTLCQPEQLPLTATTIAARILAVIDRE